MAEALTSLPQQANQLELRDLKTAELASVTLTVAGGECVVLSGSSGSGKSRLLRAIADLDACIDTGVDAALATANETGVDDLSDSYSANTAVPITLGGVDYHHYSGAAWRRRVAYVAAESQWWFDDVAGHFSIKPSTDQMSQLGLDKGLMGQAVNCLSTGERQRLALLRVLVQRPQVLLLDEPTASLDPKATRAVEQMITAYRQQYQAAIIWVSHDRAQAQRVGQRYFHIEQGRLIEHRGLLESNQEPDQEPDQGASR